MKYILAVLQAPCHPQSCQVVDSALDMYTTKLEAAEPVLAGEEELSVGGQVVGAHDVAAVHRQGQSVAVTLTPAVCVARTTLLGNRPV